MIILRNKLFANVNNMDQKGLVTNLQDPKNTVSRKMSGNDLQIEQMKTIRQNMITQRQRQTIQAQERLARSKQLGQIQKTEMKKDLIKNKQLADAIENSNDNLNPAERNWGLVKTTSKINPPVSMKQ